MKKPILTAALLALALGACHKTTGGGSAGTPTPETPQVGVSNDKIMVSPDPIQFTKGQKDVKITWQLPKDTKFSFPRNGITFMQGIEEGNSKPASEEFVRCGPEGKGETFACTNLNTVKGRYKYVITLQGGDKTPPPLDPIVVND